jgi:hypothetical protein
MGWKMYQVWYSEDAAMKPGPRFRLLQDALRYIARPDHERSFAIRTPEGEWYRDTSGRAIFGRSDAEQEWMARGSGEHPVPRRDVELPDDEATTNRWPALGTDPRIRRPDSEPDA